MFKALRSKEKGKKVTLHFVLCRHKGIIPSIIRLITRSNYDHICFYTKKGHERTYFDFNLPTNFKKYPIGKRVPWDFEKEKCTVKMNQNLFESKLCSLYMLTYSPLCNLNYITLRLFNKLVFEGNNCVTAIGHLFSYEEPNIRAMSPETMISYLSLKELTYETR